MQISLINPPESAPPYCWLVKLGENRLGIHNAHGWCIQLAERVAYFDSENMCMPLLPILEMKVEDFEDFLRDSAKSNLDCTKFMHLFPKVLLLKHVFHTALSSYWPERALEWLRSDNNIYSQFQNELELFSENKVMHQSSRQKAKKILSEIQRNKGDLHHEKCAVS